MRGRRSPDSLCAHDPEDGHGTHELRAVDEGQAFLAGELDWLEADLAQRSRTVEELAVDHRLPLADERQRKVCERSQVAARPDRATGRNDGDHAAVEQRDEELGGSTRAPE